MGAYPVLISVYHRLDHLKQSVDSLKGNALASDTDLYIVSDAAKTSDFVDIINEVRSYVNSITGFRNVHLLAWDENKGGEKSIRDAFNVIWKTNEALIFMEDDNVVSPHFLDYMNFNLNKWKTDPKVYMVCGYLYPITIPDDYEYDVLFYKDFNAWGFGVWRDKYIDHSLLTKEELLGDKKTLKSLRSHSHASYYIVQSDAIFGRQYGDGRISFVIHREGFYSIFPKYPMVKNIGHDGSGEHCGVNEFLQKQDKHDDFYPQKYPDTVIEDERINKIFRDYRSYSNLKIARILLGRIYHKLKRIR